MPKTLGKREMVLYLLYARRRLSNKGSINKCDEKYQFWQQENHPIECFNTEILESKKKYIHENPLRAGIVRNEWDYVYSSAIDYYCNKNGLLALDFV
ncbi:MAG: hypothetical protein U0V72_10295 [Cytophagales bacterium]